MNLTLLLFISVFLFICINAWQQEDGEDCEDPYPRCVFVAAVGLSGSTTVMDVLNQHPEVHIRGENSGIFNSIYQILTEKMKWNTDYEQLISDQKFNKLMNFQTHTYEDAHQGIIQMFKYLYGHDDNWGKVIGFKEIRFYSKKQLDFMRGLCQDTKIIFQYSQEVHKISQRLWYRTMSNSEKQIKNRIQMFKQYHDENPNSTFISTIDDFKNPDYAKNLFEFLGLSLDGVEIDVGRLYRSEKNREKQILQKKQNQEKEKIKQKQEQKKIGQQIINQYDKIQDIILESQSQKNQKSDKAQNIVNKTNVSNIKNNTEPENFQRLNQEKQKLKQKQEQLEQKKIEQQIKNQQDKIQENILVSFSQKIQDGDIQQNSVNKTIVHNSDNTEFKNVQNNVDYQ